MDPRHEKSGRKLPREDRYGLPPRNVRVYFDLTPLEREILWKALAKISEELSKRMEGKPIEPKEALMVILQLILETDPVDPQGRVLRPESLYTILLHLCQKCRASHLMTPDGPVEVPLEVVDRVAGEARVVEIKPEEERPPESSVQGNGAENGQKNGAAPAAEPAAVTIDRPNPPALARKVLLRDGQVCANPFCRRRLGLHAHHIRMRSQGGATELWNEVAVCSLCHASIHQGLLDVRGDPLAGLQWHTRADRIDVVLRGEAEELAQVPAVLVQAGPGAPPTPEAGGQNSTIVESASEAAKGDSPDLGLVVAALRRLGYTKRDAEDRAARAWNGFKALKRPPEPGEVVREAIAL